MRQQSESYSQLPSYTYYVLDDGRVDISIYVKLDEKVDEDGNTVYIYDANHIRTENFVEESEVANNIEFYFNYTTNEKETIEQQLTDLQMAMIELMEVMLDE